ncbi:MAG: SH3 domain-containing protein [Anaerolineae bacterium]|nr:SH3 domain-containing protein [Anaerolineae bacterium]
MKKTVFRVLLVGCLLSAVLMAVLPAPSTHAQSGTMFQDTFDDPASGWETANSADWQTGYRQGAYYGDLGGESSWGYIQFKSSDPAWNLADFTLEVDVIPVANVGFAGVVFRCIDQDSFYTFHVRPGTGEYRILRADQPYVENWGRLADWTYSPAVQIGGANRLGIRVEYSNLEFYINGQYVTTIQDSTYFNGWIGLFVGRTSDEYRAGQWASYTWDNVVISDPSVVPSSAAGGVAPGGVAQGGFAPDGAAQGGVAQGGVAQGETAAPGADILFQDDFTNPNSGWAWQSEQNPNWNRIYQNDQLRIEIGGEWTWGYVQLNPGDPAWNLGDYTLEVDVIPAGNAGFAGVVFRRADPYVFYTFHIRPSTGHYRLMQAEYADIETWTPLVDWTWSPAITSGQTPTRLTIVVAGSSISLYANGEFLTTVQGFGLYSGWIGLFVGRSADEIRSGIWSQFQFDNVVLRSSTTAPAVPVNPAPVINPEQPPAAPANQGNVPVVTCTADSADNDNINVRSGPGTGYPQVGTLYARRPVPVVGVYDDWLVVDLGVQQGYVARWVVTLTGDCLNLPAIAPAPGVVPAPAEPAGAEPGGVEPAGIEPGGIEPDGMAMPQVMFWVEGGLPLGGKENERQISIGNCVDIWWIAENVPEATYQGQYVSGSGVVTECPTQSTVYTLDVLYPDGTREAYTIFVKVHSMN